MNTLPFYHINKSQFSNSEPIVLFVDLLGEKTKQNQSNSLVLPCNEQKICYCEDVNKRCQHLFKVNERNCCCLHFN